MSTNAAATGLRAWAAWGVPAAAVVGSVGYSLASAGLSVPWAAFAYLAWVAALVALAFVGLEWAGLDGGDVGIGDSGGLGAGMTIGAGLVALYVVVLVQPGFYQGFVMRPIPEGLSAVVFVASIPLVAVASAVLFFGLLLRATTARVGLASGLTVSSVAYGISFSSFADVLGTSGSGFVGYAVLTVVVAGLTGFVLGATYYKSNWNLNVPAAVGGGILGIATFLPVGPRFPSLAEEYAVEALALVVVLAAAIFGLREHRILARRYLGPTGGPQRDRFLARSIGRSSVRRSAVTLGLAAVAVSTAVGASGLLLGTTTPMLAVASGSMSPTLVRGDLVLVQHVAPSEVTVGTILVFSSRCLPGPTIHRVVAISSAADGTPQYTTRGDANPAPDACPVTYGEVEGRVVSVVPALGYPVLYPGVTLAALAGLTATLLLLPQRAQRFPRRRAA